MAKQSKKDKSLNDAWEGCDDCAICRAMKSAESEDRELGGEELMKAFTAVEIEQAGKENLAIWDDMDSTVRKVGPEMFDDDPELLNKDQIIIKRKEIESELEEMLEDCNSDFDLPYIKDTVYNLEEYDDLQDIIAIFDDGDMSHLSNIVDIIDEIWHYFPQKSLGGLSVAEKLLEHSNKNK